MFSVGYLSPQGCRKLKEVFFIVTPPHCSRSFSFLEQGGCNPPSGPPEALSRAEELAGGQRQPWAPQPQPTRRASAGPGRGASRLEPGGLPGLLTAAFDKAPLCTGWGGPRPAGASSHLEASTGPGQPARLTAAPPRATRPALGKQPRAHPAAHL